MLCNYYCDMCYFGCHNYYYYSCYYCYCYYHCNSRQFLESVPSQIYDGRIVPSQIYDGHIFCCKFAMEFCSIANLRRNNTSAANLRWIRIFFLNSVANLQWILQQKNIILARFKICNEFCDGICD